MACNGDDTEPEGKINHWCNVSGEKAWLTLAEGKANARGSIYRLVRRTSQLTHFRARLPVNGKGQPDSAMRLRQFNLCLWIMDIPSEWRPIYVLYHAHPPLPHHLFWLGLWLDSWRFYWWWTSWFIRSSQARPSIRAPCQDRHAECTVTCCLWLTDWLAVLPAFSAMLLTAATTPRHEAVKQCVQFMQPLNYPCLFPSFIKTSTPFFFSSFFIRLSE